MDSYSVMIARFPGNNSEMPCSTDYVLSLVDTLKNELTVSNVDLWQKSDTPITMVRNGCVKDALALKTDYLLMVDSDMSPDIEPDGKPFWDVAWDFMMKRRRSEGLAQECNSLAPATIAAPYCGPHPTENVYVFEWARQSSDDPDVPFKMKMIDRDRAADFTGITHVAALPTGLILYDMRVFKALPMPWFDYEWGDKERTIKITTEDVYQTRNASLMGMPQFCAWDCWAGHNKNKVVRKPRPLTIRHIQQEFAAAITRAVKNS